MKMILQIKYMIKVYNILYKERVTRVTIEPKI